jgi:dihydrolipoamide dehydrogenase
MPREAHIDTDVAIIGAGTAGLAALREVRKRGRRCVVIDPGPLGTTCARVGCMPSKLLIEPANALHRRGAFGEFGIRGGEGLQPDLPAVLARVRKLRDDFVAGALGAIRNLDEPLISARARLLGPNEIAVDDRRIRARSIVIATGSAPIVPQPWQSQFAEHLLTTDTLFEQHDLPACMAVVGAGAIGLELAQALARLGIEIHVFDQATQLPGITDAVVHDSLLRRLRSEFSLHLGAAAELSRTPQGLLEVTNGSARVQVERVLIAIGRRPNLAGLGLEALGITLDERGMPPLDPRSLQVGELPVFLCGDANGERPLLHEAADEGHIAGINAAEIAAAEAGDLPEAGRSKIHHFRRRTPLAIIFTAPNFARIGQDLEALAEQDPIIGEADFSRQGRARVAQHDYGKLRLYASRDSGRLLGAQLCMPAGEHIAHLLALAVHQELTVDALLGMPFYHPVLEEGLRSALRHAASQLAEGAISDLATCGPLGVEALD